MNLSLPCHLTSRPFSTLPSHLTPLHPLPPRQRTPLPHPGFLNARPLLTIPSRQRTPLVHAAFSSHAPSSPCLLNSRPFSPCHLDNSRPFLTLPPQLTPPPPPCNLDNARPLFTLAPRQLTPLPHPAAASMNRRSLGTPNLTWAASTPLSAGDQSPQP